MNTFYFNTGVRPSTVHNPPFPYKYHEKKGHSIARGVLEIPFDCDAPQDAEFLFGCDNPDLPESKIPNVIVREIFNTSLVSKYAYFKV